MKRRLSAAVEPWRDGGRSNQRGQAIVELALLLPLLMMFCMGVLDFGRAFNSWVVMQNAAREGAFFAAKNCYNSTIGATPCSSYVQTVVLGEAAPVLSNATVSDVVVSGPYTLTGNSAEHLVQVKVSYAFHPVTAVIDSVVNMTAQVAVPEGP